MNRLKVLTLCLFCALFGFGCEEPFPNATELDTLRGMWGLPSRAPVDSTNHLVSSVAAATLGKKLFNDPLLSSCGTVSCATCHEGEGLAYDEPTAPGCNGQRTERNPPGLLNVAHAEWLMWDGRADRLWNQARLPFLSPAEMASSPALLRARLSEGYDAEYIQLFGASAAAQLNDEQLLVNFGKVLAAYMTTLGRTQSPFDADVRRFVEAAEAGNAEDDPAHFALKTFFRRGRCAGCHQGPLLTDNKFHVIGVKDTSASRDGASPGLTQMLDSPFRGDRAFSDDASLIQGRLKTLEQELAEHPEQFLGAFRTQTLRNVALTAPYMHTGALSSLEEVVDFYDAGGDAAGTFHGTLGETIEPLHLTPQEKAALVKLLESMTGTVITGQ